MPTKGNYSCKSMQGKELNQRMLDPSCMQDAYYMWTLWPSSLHNLTEAQWQSIKAQNLTILPSLLRRDSQLIFCPQLNVKTPFIIQVIFLCFVKNHEITGISLWQNFTWTRNKNCFTVKNTSDLLQDDTNPHHGASKIYY